MRRTRRYLLSLLILLLLGGGGGYFLYRAAAHVPAFYSQELQVAPEMQQQDADQMVEQTAKIFSEFQHTCRWTQAIKAKTINAWLAVELPQNHPGLMPSGMRDPRVHIDPQGITLAAWIDRYGFHGVVSLEVSAFVESEDVIGLKIHAARFGAIPWSLQRVLSEISTAARKAGVQMQWRQDEGDPVALVTVTPAASDAKYTIRVENVKAEDGQLIVTGTTEKTK